MEASERKSFQIKVSIKGETPIEMKEIKLQQVLTIPPLMNLEELIETIVRCFRIPYETYQVELNHGFPPRKLIGGNSLVSKCVHGGDVINCQLISKSQMSKKRSNHIPTNPNVDISENESNTSTSNNISNHGRKQREASKAANASFKTVIAQQNKYLSEESVKTSAKYSKKSLSEAQAAALQKMKAARIAVANSRKLERLEGGRALNEDEPMNDSLSHQERNRKTSSLFKNTSSEDDVSFALINAINGGSNTKMSKVLRSAMKKSIQKSYEVSRAIVRTSAIASKSAVQFEPILSSELVNNGSGTFNVKYSKGIEGVGFYEDKCHIISCEMLSAVLKSVYNQKNNDHDDDIPSGREMLKPANMALLSPRVFWSLWYYYRDSCSSLEEALEKLLPELDWKFLYQRSRQLSEKAKDNLAQEQIKRGEKYIDHPAGLKAIKDVEKAMEEFYDVTISNTREKAAQAALSRFVNKYEHDYSNFDWTLDTPTEEDEEELRECISICGGGLSEVETDFCIHALLSAKVKNWRILANCTTMQIQGYISSDTIQIKEDNIYCWILEAQRRSIDEIMLEILEGNQDLFEALRDQASSGTPKDLSLWHEMPGILLEVVPSLHHSNNDKIEDRIAWYCAKAKHVLKLLPWLSEYSTSIGNK